MIKNKRTLIFMCIVLGITFSILATLYILNERKCKNTDTFIIGMSQANLFEPWRICMDDEIKEEAKKHNNIKIIYKDAGGDTEKQKKDIEDLMNFGADLLIVSINDSEKLTPIVKKAHESIPVIVLDRAVDGYDYTLYIGSDNESIGRQAGELVSELGEGKNIHIIEVQGLLNSNPDEERSKGFKDVIGRYENINIDRTVIAEWQKDQAQDKIEEILKEDKNINVIFAHSDYMALGAYNATITSGIHNINIIGVDGLPGHDGGEELVEKGILKGTFTCATGGKEAVKYAIKILNGEKDIPKKILLECEKITKDNIQNYGEE